MNTDLNDITLPKLLKQRASMNGAGEVAIRRKGLGIWQCCSWHQYFSTAASLALGLSAINISRGDRLAIISSNSPESLYCELAAQIIGAIPVHLHSEYTANEITDSIKNIRPSVIIAENQEQVDKILEFAHTMPWLRHIVYINKRGLRRYNNGLLLEYANVISDGAKLKADRPELIGEFITSGSSSDTALICLTSGTCGDVKAVPLTFRNIISMATALHEADGKKSYSEYVSMLPISWFGEHLMTAVLPLISGYTVNFPEKHETRMTDLREIGPDLLLLQPGMWESIAASVQSRMADSTPFKKFMFKTFIPPGRRYANAVLSGTKPHPVASAGRFLANILLYKALNDRLGLSKVSSAFTSGATLDSDTLNFFHGIGINIRHLYGWTEAGGFVCMHNADDVKVDTVGKPLPGIKIDITDNCEIVVSSAGLTFYNTAENYIDKPPVDSNGRLKSADAGFIDSNGHLVITDRLSNLSPDYKAGDITCSRIENCLRKSPFIAEAIVYGSKSTQISALIGLSPLAAGKWASDKKLSYKSFSDLAALPEIVNLVAAEIDNTTKQLSYNARIFNFAIIYKVLDADDGELTRTGQVRRNVISKKYGNLVEALNANKDKVEVDTTIEFSDGKSGQIRTTVTIRNI